MNKINLTIKHDLTYRNGIRRRLETGERLTIEEQEELRLWFRDHAIIAWGLEDVFAQKEGKDLTDEEAREVLFSIENKHDATVGINWDVIDYWIAEVRANGKHD